MTKLSKLVLMLSLVFSGALCYANGIAETEVEKGEGIPLEVKEKVIHGSSDKSDSIVPTLDSHVLKVMFCENLGQVSVEITTDTGAMVDCVVAQTPNGLQFYISNAGSYIVNFTLPNGDEYYGEFEVE